MLERIYSGSEQINAAEMRRRAVLAELPPVLIKAIGQLPEGLYSRREAAEALQPAEGVDPANLSDEDLIREMESLGNTRAETVQHGSWAALARHTTRTHELENEYLRRYPERDIATSRTRTGARALQNT